MIFVYHLGTADADCLFRAVCRRERVVATRHALDLVGFLLRRIVLARSEPFPVARVDLPRGYGRKFFPLVRGRLRAARRWCESRASEKARVVVFTMPHLAPLAADCADAARAYLVCDDFRGYGWGHDFVARREQQMVDSVDHVFCVSRKLRDRFISDYGVAPGRCHVLPHAAVSGELLPEPLREPQPLPPEAGTLERPVAGMIGNTGSTDFGVMLDVARALPWLHWLIVGPKHSCVTDARETARQQFLALPNVRHVGARPHSRLYEFARSFDVGVTAYHGDGVAPFGSPVRLFIHMAATRPIVSLRGGCAQCEDYARIQQMVDSPDGMIEALSRLRDAGFEDGLERERWRLARENTWEARADTFLALMNRQGAG